MTYVAAESRYERMRVPPLRPERAPAPRRLARPLAELRPRPAARHEPRDRAARLRPRHHALRPGEQLRPAVRLGRGELRPAAAAGPRARIATSWSSRQGRLRHVAGPVRRVGLAQVPAREPRPEPRSAWGSTTSTSSTRTASTRRRRSRRRWARSTPRCARARRSTPASRPTRRERTREAPRSCASSGRRSLIHQPSYSMLNRWIEPELLDVLGELGVGCIVFSPLAQGMLTDKYLDGIPEGSRASRDGSLSPRLARRAGPRQDPRAERDRGPSRPDARADWRWRGRCATRE